MGNYSIKDLERLSGIKAHTIRIWEQRYQIIQPQRTRTNIRFYSTKDLRKLLKISLLNAQGYKISHIARFSEAQMIAEIEKITNATQHPSLVSALTLSMVDLDEQQFEKQLNPHIVRYGLEETMATVVLPFLERVGIMWMTGAINTAQERFVSHIVRRKLMAAIDGISNYKSIAENTFLLFCPMDEHNDIELLYMFYVLRSRKQKVLYLGTGVPLEDLVSIGQSHSPRYLFVYVTTAPVNEELQQYIHNLGEKFPDSQIWLIGSLMEKAQFDLPINVMAVSTMQQAMEKLEFHILDVFHNN